MARRASRLIERSGGLVSQGLVLPLEVVVGKVALEPVKSVIGRCVVVDVDFLIFDRSPEAFAQDVIHATAPAIHADADALRLQDCHVLLAGILAALVRVENVGLAVG